jgi:hypothetical protein
MIRMRCHSAGPLGVRGSAHTFRYTMAKNFLLNGGSVYALQTILGHTTLEMTRKYIHFLNSDLRSQHEKWSPIESDPTKLYHRTWRRTHRCVIHFIGKSTSAYSNHKIGFLITERWPESRVLGYRLTRFAIRWLSFTFGTVGILFPCSRFLGAASEI